MAVIDCRGGKLARRFFTRWHEIAHRLTTHADQGATEPAYRSEHDPIERMMDEIAGHVGFYGPFFEPVFGAAHAGKALLTFETVKAVLDGGFPEASFQATLNACAKRLPTPVVYLEAAIAYKKAVKKRVENDSPGLFGNEEPPAGNCGRSGSWRTRRRSQEKFVIPTNMRVPEASVIRRLFVDETASDGPAEKTCAGGSRKGKKLEGGPSPSRPAGWPTG